MFVKNAFSVFITQIITFLLSFAASVILTRTLGPTGKGQLTLLTTFLGILTLVTNPGLSAAGIYFMNRQPDWRANIAASVLWLQILLALAAAALTIVLAPLITTVALSGRVAVSLVILTALMLPVTMLTGTVTNLLVGSQDIIGSNKVKIASVGSQLALLLILAALSRIGLTAVIIASGASALIASSLGFYILRRNGLPLRLRRARGWNRELLKYGLKGWAGNVMQFFNYRLDVFIVNAFVGAAAVGQYSVAVTLAESIWYIPTAVSVVLFPKTSADWNAAKHFTPIAARNTALITTLAALALAVLSRPLIALVYKPQFLPAVAPLLALLPGIVFLGVGKVLSSDMAGRGKPQYGAWSALVSLAVTVAFDLLLIPRWGPTGAALASTLSYGLSSLVLLFLYVRLSGNSVAAVLLPRRSDVQLYVNLARTYTARWRARRAA